MVHACHGGDFAGHESTLRQISHVLLRSAHAETNGATWLFPCRQYASFSISMCAPLAPLVLLRIYSTLPNIEKLRKPRSIRAARMALDARTVCVDYSSRPGLVKMNLGRKKKSLVVRKKDKNGVMRVVPRILSMGVDPHPASLVLHDLISNDVAKHGGKALAASQSYPFEFGVVLADLQLRTAQYDSIYHRQLQNLVTLNPKTLKPGSLPRCLLLRFREAKAMAGHQPTRTLSDLSLDVEPEDVYGGELDDLFGRVPAWK